MSLSLILSNGAADIFIEVEPLGGRRHIEISQRGICQDWATFIKGMPDERYSLATKVRLVMDNLNTHCTASLYEAFPLAEARRLAGRLEIHYTPKYGSWLNVTEIKLSALSSQCLNRLFLISIFKEGNHLMGKPEKRPKH